MTNIKEYYSRNRGDVLALSSILVLLFIYFGRLITNGGYFFVTSYFFPPDPNFYFDNVALSSWNHDLFGTPTLQVQNILYLVVMRIFFALFSTNSSGVFVFFLLSLAVFSSYIFLRALGFLALPSFVSILFFISTPWLLGYILRSGNYTILVSYVALLLLTINLIEYFKRGNRKSLVISGFSVLLIATHPPSFLVGLIMVVIISLNFLMNSNEKLSSFFVKIFVLAGVLLLFSSYLLVSFVSQQKQSSETSSFGILSNPMIGTLKANSASLFTSYVWIGLGQVGTNIPPSIYFIIYSTIFIIVLGTILLSGVNSNYRVFLISYIVSVFLLKGYNEPFAGVYLWFFENIPFFSVVRNPAHFRIIFLMSSIVLISSATTILLKQLDTKRKFLTISAKLPLLLLSSSLILAVIAPIYFNSFSDLSHNRVPLDYINANDYLINDLQTDTFRLFIPGSQLSRYYTWSSVPIESEPISQDIPSITGQQFIGTGILRSESQLKPSEEYQLITYLFSKASSKKNVDFTQFSILEILGLLNTKYLLIHNDTMDSAWYHPSDEITSFLALKKISLAKEYGAVKLYTNPNYRQNIYFSNTVLPYDNFEDLQNSFFFSDAKRLEKVTYLSTNTFQKLLQHSMINVSILEGYSDDNTADLLTSEELLHNTITYSEGQGNVSAISMNFSSAESAKTSILLDIQNGSFGFSFLAYPIKYKNLSNYSTLLIDFNGTASNNTISVYLHTSPFPPIGYNYYKWRFKDDFSGWKTVVFELNSPNDAQYPTFGAPSLDDIGRISFVFEQPGNWAISNLRVGKGAYFPKKKVKLNCKLITFCAILTFCASPKSAKNLNTSVYAIMYTV